MVNVLTADSVLIQCDLGMMSVLMDDSILITSVLGVVNVLKSDIVFIELLERRCCGFGEHLHSRFCSHCAFRVKVF